MGMLMGGGGGGGGGAAEPLPPLLELIPVRKIEKNLSRQATFLAQALRGDKGAKAQATSAFNQASKQQQTNIEREKENFENRGGAAPVLETLKKGEGAQEAEKEVQSAEKRRKGRIAGGDPTILTPLGSDQTLQTAGILSAP